MNRRLSITNAVAVKKMNEYPDVTRVEVIEPGNRAYVLYSAKNVQISFQDDGRTLKIFVEKSENEST
jgi:hypothetical protein